MALDPGWAALLGAGVGGIVTLGATGLGVLGQRRERREAVALDDHRRDLDRRRDLYAECLQAVHACQAAMASGIGEQTVRIANRAAHGAPAEVDAPSVDAAIERLRSESAALNAYAARLDLIAPLSVCSPFASVVNVLFVRTQEIIKFLKAEPPERPRSIVTHARELLVSMHDAVNDA